MADYTDAQLSKMNFMELRKIAKELKISISGKKPADIIREIKKKQSNAKGKGTAADPKSGTKKGAKPAPKKAAKVEEEEDDEEEEDTDEEETEEEEPAPKKGKKAAPVEEEDEDEEAVEEEVGDLEARVTAIEGLVSRLVTAVNTLAKKVKVVIDLDPPADEEDEEEETEDDEEEEDEPKPSKGAKSKKAAEEDEDDEEEEVEEEEETEDEEEETDEPDADEEALDIDDKEVKSLVKKDDRAGLVKIAKSINEVQKGAVTYSESTNAKRLGEKILEFLKENAEEVEEEADEEDDAEEETEETEKPEFVKKGAKLQANFEDEGGWADVIVKKIDEDEQTVTVTVVDEDSTADVPWSLLREPKKIVKKKA